MAFKMKQSPMKRNFNIGNSPMKQTRENPSGDHEPLSWLKDKFGEYTGYQTYEEWMAKNHPDVNLKTEQDPIPEGMSGTRDLAAKMEALDVLRREAAEGVKLEGALKEGIVATCSDMYIIVYGTIFNI